MKEEMFNELLESIRQGGASVRGEMRPSRVYHYDTRNIKRIREKYHLSQSQFAAMLGISVRTLHNWEQGRRSPAGPARVLLEVAATHPEALLETVQKMQSK
jgi:putative transcriptional regulator